MDLPTTLQTLWEEGYFKEIRDTSLISQVLAERGFHFQMSHINLGLVRSVRKGYLMRTKKNGRWAYVQKFGPDTAVGKRTGLISRYELHPRIKEVSLKQFQDGYFKEAIQNALVEVVDQVKIKSGRPKIVVNGRSRDLDGDDLMNQVFGCDNSQVPKIKFNDLVDGLDRAEQRGIMHLFKGIVGVRDKKAHLNFVQNDPLKTMEYLSLASLLLRLLDENAPTKKKKAK